MKNYVKYFIVCVGLYYLLPDKFLRRLYYSLRKSDESFYGSFKHVQLWKNFASCSKNNSRVKSQPHLKLLIKYDKCKTQRNKKISDNNLISLFLYFDFLLIKMQTKTVLQLPTKKNNTAKCVHFIASKTLFFNK